KTRRPGRRIDRVDAEDDRLGAGELIVELRIACVTGRIEVDDVVKEDQAIAARQARWMRRGQQRDRNHRHASAKVFHADKVTESIQSVQRCVRLRDAEGSRRYSGSTCRWSAPCR